MSHLLDIQFQIAVENFDVVNTSLLLKGIPQPSQETIDYAFSVACALKESNLLRAILDGGRTIKVSKALLSSTFIEFVHDGLEPSIIEVLQAAVSPRDLADQHRYNADRRKEGSSQELSHYLVSVSEQDLIKEIERRIYTIRNSKCLRSRQLEVFRRLSAKFWLNDAFKDAVRFNFKLVVERILSYPESRPDAPLVDVSFVDAIIDRGNMSLARILSSHISQSAIDTAFSQIPSLINAKYPYSRIDEVLSFLIDGRTGFLPESTLIDELYYSLVQEGVGEMARLSRVLDPLVDPELRNRLKRESLEKKHRMAFSENRSAIMEIHGYSGTAVHHQPSSSSLSSSRGERTLEANIEIPSSAPMPLPILGNRSKKNTLNDTIISTIRRRIPASIIPYTSEQVSESLSKLLTSEGAFTIEQQERALEFLEAFLEGPSAELLGICLQFIELNSPPGDRSMPLLWMKGFVGESVDANSCRMGVQERCITGLRGIGDSELDSIFQQAEGPHLARIFLMSTFNILHARLPDSMNSFDSTTTDTVQRATKNAENLALILANRSIRENSSEEAVFAALKSYACEAVTSFSVSPSDFDSIIDAVCTATAESYEFILSHFVKRITG